MEYTKDIIFNVQYGQATNTMKLGERRYIKTLIEIYEKNKFIIKTLSLTIMLIAVDLWMVSSFINLLVNL